MVRNSPPAHAVGYRLFAQSVYVNRRVDEHPLRSDGPETPETRFTVFATTVCEEGAESSSVALGRRG